MKVRPFFILIAVLGLALLGVGPAGALSPPSADKAEIVFANGGRILSVKADGSGREVLFGAGRRPANDQLGAVEPAVSPDGQKIVFGVRRAVGYESLIDVWVMDSDGSNARRLLKSNLKLRFGDPGFTPDGRILAARFSLSGRKGEARIFTMDTDGGSRKVVLRLPQRSRPWVGWKSLAEPVLSPDGEKLLYLLDPGFDGTFFEGGYGSSLRLLDLSTGKSREVSGHSNGGAWSPDATKIVFSEVEVEGDEDFCWNSADACDDFSRLRVARPDGSRARDLTRGIADERRPDWSADGRIVFQSARGAKRGIAETTEVWSVRPGGGCLTRLTNGSPASLAPVWSDPAGESTAPTACGATPPGPNAELLPAAASRAGGLWLGPSFRRFLLADSQAERGSSSFFYGDCGAIPASRCGREVILYNEDICHLRGYAAAVIGSGVIQQQRGIPLLRSTKPGRETPPFTLGFTGRTAFFVMGGSDIGDSRQQHRLEIDALRSVDSDQVAAKLPPPRFPAGDIRLMKRIERIQKRTGSVLRTARLIGRSRYLVRGNLRFARKYRAVGGYETVNCGRRS